MDRLIPEAAFEAMPQVMLLLIAAGALYFLMRGADWLVEGAAGLARRLGMSKVIVGATVVSLGTTSPEAAVSVMAAWEGRPGLALGNAVGSIIVDTGLIFGLGCAMVVLPADRFVLMRQGWVKIGACVLLAGLCYGLFAIHGADAAVGRSAGALLVLLLFVYLAVSVRWSRRHPHGEPFVGAALEDGVPESLAGMVGSVLFGLLLVVVASRFVIGSVVVLAARWDVPQVVISATLVAFGTSLPELVVGMTAIARGHRELLVGNVIGADILNVLFVVGAAALARPLAIIDPAAEVPLIFLVLHLPTMLVMIGLFLAYIARASRRGHFERWQGYPLLVLYVLYLALQLVAEAG